jgi:hypothetical protein
MSGYNGQLWRYLRIGWSSIESMQVAQRHPNPHRRTQYVEAHISIPPSSDSDSHEELEKYVSVPEPGIFYGKEWRGWSWSLDQMAGDFAQGDSEGRMIPAGFVMELVSDIPEYLKLRLSTCSDVNARYVPRLILASAQVATYKMH